MEFFIYAVCISLRIINGGQQNFHISDDVRLLVSFNSNTMGVTSVAGIEELLTHHPWFFSGVCVAQSLVLCVLFCGTFLVCLFVFFLLSVFFDLWPLTTFLLQYLDSLLYIMLSFPSV